MICRKTNDYEALPDRPESRVFPSFAQPSPYFPVARISQRQTLALNGETMKTGGNQEAQMMRKILLVLWLASLAALIFMLGNIWLHGSTVHRNSFAEDLGILWGLSFGAWAVLTWKARQ
jgi:hypothetical protein